MEITVNQETLNYSLEGEESLGEVVEGIERWLNRSEMVITSLKLGERELAAEPDNQWQDIPVAEVPRLDITARRLSEMESEQLALVDSYLEALRQAVTGVTRPDDAMLGAGLDALSILGRCLPSAAGTATGEALRQLEQAVVGVSAEALQAWPEGIRSRTAASLEVLLEAVARRRRELERPAEALQTAARELALACNGLADVSVLLQTGRQDAAMQRIGHFAEVLESALRVASAASGAAAGSLGFRDSVEALNAVLQQVVEAFAARDSVLLGDLLEYEVAPRARELAAILSGWKGSG